MSRTGLALTLALCNGLLGCSSDDAANAQFRGFPADQTCGLRVELTGDITASATGNDTDTTCLCVVDVEQRFISAFGVLPTLERQAASVPLVDREVDRREAAGGSRNQRSCANCGVLSRAGRPG